MGRKPEQKVKIQWSSKFAYAIGLVTTDGNLSPNGRSINFTSKDADLVKSFLDCLAVKNKIGRKARGGGGPKKYFVTQIGDVSFYKFLLQIGIRPKKSKTIAEVNVPDKFFFDFLRGHFDGDGTFYSYWDPRWRSSFMFYTEFMSASKKHIIWLRAQMRKFANIHGHVTKSKIEGSIYQLKYAKKESLQLLPKIYYKNHCVHLARKYLKIRRVLGTITRKHII